MKLTKEQIKFVDDYLKNKGIKFWDVRLEMVDHLVSDMESHQGSADFDLLFKQSLVNTNWHNNLKKVNQENIKSVNRIYRTKLWKEMLSILKSPLYLAGFVLLYFALRQLALADVYILKYMVISLCVFYLMVLIYEGIKIKNKKLGKSLNLQYGIFYFYFGAFFTGLPSQIAPIDTKFLWFPLIMCLFLLMTIAGYRVYKSAFKKVLKMKFGV